MAYVKVGNRVGTIGLEKKINYIAQRKRHTDEKSMYSKMSCRHRNT